MGKASLVRRIARPEPCRGEARNKPPAEIKDEDPRRDAELYPDACQHERAARLGASRQGACSALKRLKITYKKERCRVRRRTRRPGASSRPTGRPAGRSPAWTGAASRRMRRCAHGYAPAGGQCA